MLQTIDKLRTKLYEDLEAQIVATPLYEVKNTQILNGNRIFAKEEYENPTQSTFDRVYPYLFRLAEEAGLIIPGVTPVIEASTGNAGASFAWCARELGYNNATVITHADTPEARVKQIKSYGAKVIFSPAGEYASGYVRKLEQVLEEDKKSKGRVGEDLTRMYCITKINQGTNAPGLRRLVDEVYLKIGRIDYFIQGVGSGTTISGIGRALRQRDSSTKVIAIEPKYASVIRRFREGIISPIAERHELIGLGAAGLPPEKLDIDFSVIDDVISVTDEDWRTGNDLLKQNEGKEVGRSSCAAFKVALDFAHKVRDKDILILFGDPAWKYTDNYSNLK